MLVDHRLQPAKPRRRGARRLVGTLRATVQEFRLGCGDRQIRLAPAGRLQGAGRRQAQGLDRQLPEPALLGAGVRRWRGLAQAARRRDRRPGRCFKVDREALGRRARRADEQSRRPRPAVGARRVSRRASGEANVLHLLHGKGLRSADGRAQGQPRRPDDASADGGVPQGDGGAPRPRMGQVRRSHFAGREIAEIPRSRAIRRRPNAPPQRARNRRAGQPAGHHPADDGDTNRLRCTAQRDRPRRQRLRAPHRHDIAGCDGVDQSRRPG